MPIQLLQFLVTLWRDTLHSHELPASNDIRPHRFYFFYSSRIKVQQVQKPIKYLFEKLQIYHNYTHHYCTTGLLDLMQRYFNLGIIHGPSLHFKDKLSELPFKCDYWPILVAKEVFGILTKCWVRSIFYHPSWDYNVNVPKIPRPSIIWKSRLLKYHSEQKNYIYLNYYRKVFDWPSFVGKKICSILLCLAYCPRSSLGPWASSKTATSYWKSLSSRSKSFHLLVWLCPSLFLSYPYIASCYSIRLWPTTPGLWLKCPSTTD